VSDYIIRPAKGDQDFHFITKTWLESYRSSKSNGLLSIDPLTLHCPTCNEPLGYDYKTVMNIVVRRILARPGVTVLVAANPREKPPIDLHGWIAVEEKANVPVYRPPRYELEVHTSEVPLVHYVYVKKAYRGFGLARSLFAKAGVDPTQHFLYTCSTSLSVQVEKAFKIPRAEWMPACVRFTKETSQIHDASDPAAPVQQPGAHPDPRQQPGRNLQERRRG
jgi:hypothetical protein